MTLLNELPGSEPRGTGFLGDAPFFECESATGHGQTMLVSQCGIMRRSRQLIPSDLVGRIYTNGALSHTCNVLRRTELPVTFASNGHTLTRLRAPCRTEDDRGPFASRNFGTNSSCFMCKALRTQPSSLCVNLTGEAVGTFTTANRAGQV